MTQAPAVVDTALAVLAFPDEIPIPVALHTVQDTVLFGEVVYVIVDFADPDLMPAEPELTAGEDWLVLEKVADPGFLDRLLGRSDRPGPEVKGLDPAQGTRVALPYRIYRTQPFQIQVGPFTSGVIEVQARIAGTEETAAIRAPRPVGWSPLVILLLILALVLILGLARLLWDRGRKDEELRDWPLAPPAWLAAGIELRALYREGSLSRGDSRIFLDGLAGITRRFVAGRYRINAQEMTGREILNACSGLGHAILNPGSFARLVDEVDHHRYDPETSAPGWCRDQAIHFFQLMGKVRVTPRYSEVPAELLIEGEKAWVELRREFSGAIGHGQDRDPAPTEREA